MEQDYSVTSSRHRRVEDGREGSFSHVDRNITVVRSFDWVDLMIVISPTMSPKRACLKGFDISNNDLINQRNIANANVLKYASESYDFIFHIRNKKSFTFDASPFTTMSRFIDPIEAAFADDDNLILVLEHKRKDLNIEYYL